MRIFSRGMLTLLAVLFCASNSMAQKAAFTRAFKKITRQVESSSRPQSVKNAAASLLQSEEKLGGSRARDMFESFFKPLPLGTPSGFVAQNRRLQEAAIRNLLEKEAYLSLQKEVVNKAVVFQLYDGVIPYGKLIDPASRVVFMGETHEQKRVAQEVFLLMASYQKEHPDKHIYYASEFVDDLSASGTDIRFLKKEEIPWAVRKRPFYRPYTEWILKFGIPVVGLENPSVSLQAVAENYTHNASSAAYRKWSSPAGVAARNKYWAHIIENILQKDPQAVVFVHAGMGHTNYNQPEALSLKLRKYKPFVLEFNYALGANLNGLIEQYAPFPKEINQYRARLRSQDEWKFYNLLAVRLMKDKRWALATGCDMHVFFHDWARSNK